MAFVRLSHERYLSKTGPEKEAFIAEKFRNCQKTRARGGFKYQFVVEGDTVCLQGLARIYGFTRWHLKRGKSIAETGHTNQHLSRGVRLVL